MDPMRVIVVGVGEADGRRAALLLQGDGHDVALLGRREEALAAVVRRQADAALVGTGAPFGAAGLVGDLLRTQPKLPILILAPRGTETETKSALAAGARDMIRLPADAEELRLRMWRLTGRVSAPGSNGAEAGPADLVRRLLSSEISFEDLERELLLLALQRTHGNQSRAARLLGLTRRTMQYRIEKHRIDAAPLRG